MSNSLKAKDLRKLDHEALSARLTEQRDQLYHLRYKMHVEEVENNNTKSVLRRNIARILTILREQALTAEHGLTSSAQASK